MAAIGLVRERGATQMDEGERNDCDVRVFTSFI
jgi:hypothetical protein